MNLPRALYHGTTATRVPAILEHGLMPGERVGDSNYAHKARLPSPYVYLSHGWALHYALLAATSSEEVAVVRIDTDVLDRSKLRPDEDYYFEWVLPNEGMEPNPGETRDDVVQRVLHRMEREPERAVESLHYMSNVAFRGSISNTAILGVSIFHTNNALIELYNKAVQSANFRPYPEHARQFYSFLRLIFGEHVSAQELINPDQVSSYSNTDLLKLDQKLSQIEFTRVYPKDIRV